MRAAPQEESNVVCRCYLLKVILVMATRMPAYLALKILVSKKKGLRRRSVKFVKCHSRAAPSINPLSRKHSFCKNGILSIRLRRLVLSSASSPWEEKSCNLFCSVKALCLI